MERLCSSNVGVRNDNIKCPIRKSIFTVNLLFKLFRATVANADTGSLKFLHALFDTYLDHMLAKFEPKRMVQNVPNLKFIDKKSIFLNHFDLALTPFCKTFL